jgi:hypothetical protein
VFDSNASFHGNELASDLTALGIPFTEVDPATPGAISDAMFNHSTYSAFAVASEVTCGGCDNTPADNAAVAAHLTAIANFVNAGGGILGLAGAEDPNAYAYVPDAAANGGGNPPPDGFVETAAGTAEGLLAENGDITHNFFPTPGTAGMSSAWKVAETNSDNIESVFIAGASITCTGPSCTIGGRTVPLPAALPLLGSALGGLGLLSQWRRRRVASV